MHVDHYQTMRLSFEQICQGQDPWLPLGNFMNDWYAYHIEERERLIQEPLPGSYPAEFEQWAVFCAASVIWFCQKYGVPCPAWVQSPGYTLKDPWFMGYPERVHEHLVETTAAEFAERNIFCGDRVYANKWEAAQEWRERRRIREQARLAEAVKSEP